MVDNGKLAVLGTDNGHIRLNLVGTNKHSFSPVAQSERCVRLIVLSPLEIIRPGKVKNKRPF
jgi:hypothetical protein